MNFILNDISIRIVGVFIASIITATVTAKHYTQEFKTQYKQRVIVTTDIGGTDPDDEQSMIHLLLCADRLHIEGLICGLAWVKMPFGIGRLQNIINAYDSVYINLRQHSDGYPTAKYLRQIATTGQSEPGMSGVGKGKDTPGSELIIAAVDSKDPRPIWLTAWGGMNTIAQALWKVKSTRTAKDVARFTSKIRIYDILGQCDAGAWIAKNFPDIIYIRNKHIYGWGPDDKWTDTNIQAFGPMGRIYPDRRWATEGDSPAFFYMLDNGLNIPDSVNFGGWGGRFSTTPVTGIRGMKFVAESGHNENTYDPYSMLSNTSDGSLSIIRWREDILNDFASRIQWSIKNKRNEANHHPEICMMGESHPSRRWLKIYSQAGSTINLDASESKDPDGDSLKYKWYVYSEPTSYNDKINIEDNNLPLAKIHIPADAKGKTIHIILEVTDDGTPILKSYRRIVIYT